MQGLSANVYRVNRGLFACSRAAHGRAARDPGGREPLGGVAEAELTVPFVAPGPEATVTFQGQAVEAAGATATQPLAVPTRVGVLLLA